MRKTAISLGLALALGVFQTYGVSQTPAQNLDTTAQNPTTPPVAVNPPTTRSDKPAENQDRKWHLKLGPVLMDARAFIRRLGFGIGSPGGQGGGTGADRKVMEAELDEKGLHEGALATPVAGYLYFPLAKKAKNAHYELEYMLNGNKVVLRLAE
jgi:hypothetical protein